MPSTSISDEDLMHLCVISIREGYSREYLFMRLKSDRKKISMERLARIWAACGGQIRQHERY